MNQQIANWDNLSEEEKQRALDLLKGQPGLNPAAVHPAAKFFEENGWVKIEKFISEDMANLLYHHVQLEAARLAYLEEIDFKPDTDIHGTFNDTQAAGDFSKYGDPIFDALLSISLQKMSELTGKDLIPTYTYHRLYTMGTELKRHKDRASCEISTTLCLGYDVSNVDLKKYPNWDWPMFVGPKDGQKDTPGLPVHMKPGDMLIYRGDIIEHWREPFMGVNHAQLFMHYNEKDGKYNVMFDGRPLLGLPASFRDDSYDIPTENQNNENVIEINTDTSKKYVID